MDQYYNYWLFNGYNVHRMVLVVISIIKIFVFSFVDLVHAQHDQL